MLSDDIGYKVPDLGDLNAQCRANVPRKAIQLARKRQLGLHDRPASI